MPAKGDGVGRDNKDEGVELPANGTLNLKGYITIIGIILCVILKLQLYKEKHKIKYK